MWNTYGFVCTSYATGIFDGLNLLDCYFICSIGNICLPRSQECHCTKAKPTYTYPLVGTWFVMLGETLRTINSLINLGKIIAASPLSSFLFPKSFVRTAYEDHSTGSQKDGKERTCVYSTIEISLIAYRGLPIQIHYASHAFMFMVKNVKNQSSSSTYLQESRVLNPSRKLQRCCLG